MTLLVVCCEKHEKHCLNKLSPLHTIYRCIYYYFNTVIVKRQLQWGKKEDNRIKLNCRLRNVTVMVQAYCNNVLWEVFGYIGVSGQGDASIGPSPLLRINKSPTGYIHVFCSDWHYLGSIVTTTVNNNM